jgi:hypothetical protein
MKKHPVYVKVVEPTMRFGQALACLEEGVGSRED